MSFETILIIILVLVACVVAFAFIAIRSAERQAEAKEQEHERQALADAQATAKNIQRRETRALAIEQALIDQLQTWSRHGIISGFSDERAHIRDPYPPVTWDIQADIRLLKSDGDSQAQWRKAVRAFADKLSGDFSMRLKNTNIKDYNFSLVFSEEEHSDS